METILYSAVIKTLLGDMVAIADEQYLYMLEFADNKNLDYKIKKLELLTKGTIVKKTTKPIRSITTELNAYFQGDLTKFKTPLMLLGSDFRKQVWQALISIPYGKTRSYKEQAIAIMKPKAFRAVANANGANRMAIVVPCHRVINSNGGLGGYSSGIERKEWLLQHEKKYL